MYLSRKRFVLALAVAAALATTSAAVADPITGRDQLKFSQQPMINTTVVDLQGVPTTYHGHDELSTAYGFGNAAIPPTLYQGRFMADDFADTANTSVLHVKWWGSYLDNFIAPGMNVDKFLIAFEPDIPASQNPAGFSVPGTPAFSQVVKRGPLAPGSGTFTETPKLVIPGVESIYEYNAELHLGKDFPQKPDTVYWLKIVAMVDAPINTTFDPYNPPASVTRWGWHNRDYTVPDPLASPAVVPGEQNQGPFQGVPVWHFQDDAVTGDVRINTLPPAPPIMPDVFQPIQNMSPTHYVDGLDGPGALGAIGIRNFSKDLAFELYTIRVPEPGTALLMVLGVVGLAIRRRSALR